MNYKDENPYGEHNDRTVKMVDIPLSVLEFWRELVDLNPQDLAPRMDRYIRIAKAQ